MRAPARRVAMLSAAAVVLAGPPRTAAAQWAGPCEKGGRPATRAAVATAAVAGNAALLIYFKQAWWSGEKADHFFFQSDWDQDFRDQDKFGHAWGGFHLTQGGVELLDMACIARPKGALLSAAYATIFQLQIEVWDGFYESYGFSYPDLIMNASGAALAVLHERAPRTRAVKPTFWYRPSAAWHRRAEHGNHPRATTDYSGQSYWLSVDVDTLLPAGARRYWPGFVRVSLGHTITDWVDPNTGGSLRAKRRLLLSLDVDPEKLPGNHPAWRLVKRQLSFVHFPSPALQLTPKVEGIAWYP